MFQESWATPTKSSNEGFSCQVLGLFVCLVTCCISQDSEETELIELFSVQERHCQSGLQVMVQLFQQLQYPDEKSMNLVVVQSKSLEVYLTWFSVWARFQSRHEYKWGNKVASRSEGKQVRARALYHVYIDFQNLGQIFLPQKIWIQGGSSYSNDSVKKIPYRFTHLLGFQLILDVVMLTTKNSHHKSTSCQLNTQSYLLMS